MCNFLQKHVFAFYRLSLYVFLGVLVTSCTKIDDYLLGKDNSPIPTLLNPLDNKKTAVLGQWSLPKSTLKQKNADQSLKPAIVASTLYLAENQGTIRAINRFTGKILWSQQLNHHILSGPTVDGGLLAVSTDAASVVLLKQDGQLLREFHLSSDVLSKPMLMDDALIAKTIDGKLYAFEISSGKTRWVVDHGASPLILKASSSPVKIAKGLILVGYPDGKLDAIDSVTGRTVWQRPFAYLQGASDIERLVDIDADPLVDKGTVYLASFQGYVGALSLQDGQLLWRQPASVYKNMVMDGQSLYFTDSDDVVWSVNKNSGHVNWKQEKLKAHGLTEPVLASGYLVFGDKMGMLHVLAKQNGQFLSRTQLSGAVMVGPTLAKSTKDFYVVTNQGQLSRFSVG